MSDLNYFLERPRIEKLSSPYLCIHEKLSHTSSYFVKSVPCICSERVKAHLSSGQNSHDQMSVQSETNGALEHDCKKYSYEETVHSSGKENHNKERSRRPDKPLYVPRALRGVKHEREKEEINISVEPSPKNNFVDGSTGEVETNSLTGQFNEDGFESISKPKVSEIYLDNMKEEEQEVTIDTSVNFSQLTYPITHDNAMSSVDRTENNQVSLKKVKHKISSESHSETDCERITFSSKENENLTGGVSAKVKSVLKSQQASENNFELKTQQNEHSDINQNAKSSESKTSDKTRSYFSDKHHSVEKNDACNMSMQKQEEKEIYFKIECKNKQETVKHSLVDPLVEGNIACSSKCNENSNHQLESNRQSFHKDRVIETKLESIESNLLQLEKSADSWETMFNEDGECLEPNLWKELCEVAESNHFKVTKITTDYESFADTKSKENENIVELFGFPVEFTTPDLISALSLFQKENYTIKWVDDCHALAVFTSPSLANQALIMHHPFVKIRALSEATKESKAKAKQCAKLHESSKPRPMTTATLARRLVSGALGIKNHVSKEQRDVEQKLLSEAREKKKLKAKQKQDMWDGVVSKN